ncbi:MAG: hypothetical protein CSB44_06285 [Gammaproteobacteria bacterium]|nr:MAG: hypothetical protein CSB44_06285 [Gammaproteobacteria bacterium]
MARNTSSGVSWHGDKRGNIARSLAILGAVFISSCSSDSDDLMTVGQDGNLSMNTPRFLLESRRIDRTAIRPEVTINGNQTVTMQRSADGNGWSGTIQVLPDQSYTIRIVWIERLDAGEAGNNPEARDLALAVREQVVQVGSDGASQTFGGLAEGNYDTNILDEDQDGISNLNEREQGTDPFTPIPPGPGDNPGDSETPGETPDPNEPTDPSAPPGSDKPDTEDPAMSDSIDVAIPRIAAADAPLIDGLNVMVDTQGQFAGEWASAVQVDHGGSLLGINNLMIDVNADAEDGTVGRRWAAVHDGEYLYIMVTVDDNGIRYRDSNGSIWEDDALELFIDVDNSKSESYDDNDYQVLFPLATSEDPEVGVTSGEIIGMNSAWGLELDFATGPGQGPASGSSASPQQDVYELRIRLGSIGLETGKPFGLELQIDDDDDGGGRDAKWGWAHPSRGDVDVDNTYLNPSYMGTAMLE